MVSEFQARVYKTLQTVPRGRVTTYQWLAKRVGCGSARAIGQALRKNPFAPRVPCHRVIGSDLGPGGFQGQTGGAVLQEKIKLLRSEGVTFRSGVLAEPGALYIPD